jgi:hypothetical protein
MQTIRFTLREMLLAAALVALAIGWWLDHRRLAALNEKQATELQVFMTPQIR